MDDPCVESKVKTEEKKNDTTSRHDCSTNIDLGAKNDKTRSKQNL